MVEAEVDFPFAVVVVVAEEGRASTMMGTGNL
jgi:hypothetical protein